jgi:hypothetical protein
MVNFEPPLPKSLPEAQLFKILSEIPADSAGMQRAAELIAEHERTLAEDQVNLNAWVSELEADGSPEALAALARHRGEARSEEPAEVEDPTAPVPILRAPKPQIPPRVSFESLLTGSNPVIADSQSSDSGTRAKLPTRARLFDFLLLPLALGLALFSSQLSAAQALLTAGAVAIGFAFALVAARGGANFSGQLATISLGVILGRFAVSLALITSVVLLAPSTLGAAANVSTLGSFGWLAAAGATVIALGLGLMRSPWLPRVLALVPLGVFAWLGANSGFTSVRFEELALADIALVGVGVFAGFWMQALALPLARTQRYAFSSISLVFIAAAAVLGTAVTQNPGQRAWAIAAAALVLMFTIGREAANGARRASVSSLAALLPLALVGLWVLSPFVVDVTPWLLLLASGFIGLATSDALLRSQPVHLPSTEQPYGFYGAFSVSAAVVWLFATAAAILALMAAGTLDIEFAQVFELPWLGEYAAVSLAIVVALLVGMMRFAVVRARELDQLSASGDTKLENLLGL